MRLILVLLSVALCSCAGSLGSRPPEIEYEIITARDQTLEELARVSTQFELSVDDDSYGWERAEIFFRQHTPGSTVTVHSLEHMVLANKEAQNGFRFSVDRQRIAQGYRYKVTCDPAFGQGDRYARNLARFIREGMIEETILP